VKRFAIPVLTVLCVACGAPPDSGSPSPTEAPDFEVAADPDMLELWPNLFCRRGWMGDPGCNLSRQPGQEVMPSISGQHVVWADSRSGTWAIWLHDMSTGVAKPITPPGTQNVTPVIDGARVVYARLPPDPQPWEFYGYDIKTGVETLFSTVPRNFGLGHFSLHDDRVVWHANRNGNWDVYMYDFHTHMERRITTHAADQADPSIHGNRIAWADKRHGGTWWDVYLFDLGTNVEQRITQQTTMGRSPVLSATRMVWGDTRFAYFSLYEYDFYANPPERHVPTSPIENSLAIDGTFVAWVNRNDANPVFYDDVFVYDLITTQEVRVTQLPARQWFPALSAPYLVWEDHRKGNADVFIEQLSNLF
jgi:beta propeller repeat protein